MGVTPNLLVRLHAITFENGLSKMGVAVENKRWNLKTGAKNARQHSKIDAIRRKWVLRRRCEA
jgi:hypothetical protein